MRFFIPRIDDEKAEELWQEIKGFMEDPNGWKHVTDRRIFRLEYVHNGKEWEAEVGKPHPYGHPVASWGHGLRS